MLTITSPTDLKCYLETRLKMAEKQGKNQHTNGMVFAFEESIRAVDALIRCLPVGYDDSEKIEKGAKEENVGSV